MHKTILCFSHDELDESCGDDDDGVNFSPTGIDDNTYSWPVVAFDGPKSLIIVVDFSSGEGGPRWTFIFFFDGKILLKSFEIVAGISCDERPVNVRPTPNRTQDNIKKNIVGGPPL